VLRTRKLKRYQYLSWWKQPFRYASDGVCGQARKENTHYIHLDVYFFAFSSFALGKTTLD